MPDNENDENDDNDENELQEIRSVSTLYNKGNSTQKAKASGRPPMAAPQHNYPPTTSSKSINDDGQQNQSESFSKVFKQRTDNGSDNTGAGDRPWYYFDGNTNTNSSQNNQSALNPAR